MQSKAPLSIFIVDDDPFCGTLYEQHMRNLGHRQITLFTNGQECLDQLTQQPAIIFLDYRMEPLDGLQVLQQIKRFNPDIYLVIISGQDDGQVAIDAQAYGAFDFIIKGDKDLIKIEVVLKKIQSELDRSKQRPQASWHKLMTLLGTA